MRLKDILRMLEEHWDFKCFVGTDSLCIYKIGDIQHDGCDYEYIKLASWMGKIRESADGYFSYIDTFQDGHQNFTTRDASSLISYVHAIRHY